VSEADELSTEKVASILEEASAFGFLEVNFTGGEPLMRRDIVDLVKIARECGLVPKMNTNGISLTESTVSELGAAGLAWGSVSIDSVDPKKHDSLRQYDGCFDLAVRGIRRLIGQGIPASITTYSRKESVHDGDLKRIVQLGHDLGVETVRILFPVPMGGLLDASNEILSLGEREKVRELNADPIVTMESPKEGTRCTAAVTKLNILPDGRVTPCVFVPRSYGNIRNQSLKNIWAKMVEFDKMWKPSGYCPFCDEEFRKRLLSGLT
jgi:MoaA/NifB/PqqE/SkfB family radical SAM enzyme